MILILLSLWNQQQNSFFDERAALMTPTTDARVKLKDERGNTFTVDNDMIDILLEKGKQTKEQFQLISMRIRTNLK